MDTGGVSVDVTVELATSEDDASAGGGGGGGGGEFRLSVLD